MPGSVNPFGPNVAQTFAPMDPAMLQMQEQQRQQVAMQRMAQMLEHNQGGSQTPAGQMVGDYYVPTSPLLHLSEQLGKIGSAGLGAASDVQGVERDNARNQARSQMLGAALDKMAPAGGQDRARMDLVKALVASGDPLGGKLMGKMLEPPDSDKAGLSFEQQLQLKQAGAARKLLTPEELAQQKELRMVGDTPGLTFEQQLQLKQASGARKLLTPEELAQQKELRMVGDTPGLTFEQQLELKKASGVKPGLTFDQQLELKKAGRAAIGEPVSDQPSSLAERRFEFAVTKEARRKEERENPPPPATAKKAIAGNDASLTEIDAAIDAAEKNPEAFGAINYTGERIQQYLDPEGVTPRAKVGSVAGVLRHDMLGASQTITENKNYAPFIPSATDDPKAVVDKLKTLRVRMKEENDQMKSAFGVKPSAAAGASGSWSGATKSGVKFKVLP